MAIDKSMLKNKVLEFTLYYENGGNTANLRSKIITHYELQITH